jgi:hypothetical protein
MNKVIENMEEDDVCVHIQNQKHGRMWSSYSPSHVVKIMDKNIGLHEVITKYPHKCYFDVDCEDGTPLETFKEIIKKHIPDAQMAISGSETETKNSYHITINNYTINSIVDRENFKQFVMNLHEENKGFDTKVYTNNRNMKIINQSKQNDSRIQTIMEDDEPKNHLITCFMQPNVKSSSEITSNVKPQAIKITQNKRINILALPEIPINNNVDSSNLKDALSLLNLMPINKDFDHKYTFMVCRFCYHNHLSFHDFHEWYKGKDDSEEKRDKWITHWNNASEFPSVSEQQLLFVLEKYYPNITKKRELLTFIEQCDISNEKFTEVETLDQNHFENDTKATIFNIGMGGGKTTQTVEYLRKNCDNEIEKDNFIWMTPNIALADNTFSRMKDFRQTSIYNEVKRKEDKSKLIQTSKNLMVCMNSLKYATDKKYKVVVIDEIETFLKKWSFNETLDGVQSICYTNFISILKSADKIILLDAFITNITIQFLKNLGINYTIIKRIDDKSFNNRDAIKFNNSKHMIIDIIKRLNEGKKLLIFYPYCKGNNKNQSMNSLKELLEQHSKTKGICHNSMTSDKIKRKLKDVNKEWTNYDFVISNNVITVGVNFDVNHFDQCYLFIANFNEMRDIVQFSYRTRNLKDNLIKYSFISGYKKADDEEN